MRTKDEELANSVEHGLRKAAGNVRRLGGNRWESRFLNGAAHRVTAVLDSDEWLSLETDPKPVTGGEDLWGALRRNASLPGPAGFVLRPPASLGLRADVVLEESADVGSRLRCAFAAFHSALEDPRGDGEEPAVRPAIAGDDGGQCLDLAALLAEAGWPFIDRASGRLAVELEAGAPFCQALAESRPGGGVSVSVQIVRWDDCSSVSRDALAALLLTVTGGVRLARAAAWENGRIEAALEVRFPAAPAAAELSWALGALSVACRHCRREAAALKDEALAGLYLALRGFAKA